MWRPHLFMCAWAAFLYDNPSVSPRQDVIVTWMLKTGDSLQNTNVTRAHVPAPGWGPYRWRRGLVFDAGVIKHRQLNGVFLSRLFIFKWPDGTSRNSRMVVIIIIYFEIWVIVQNLNRNNTRVRYFILWIFCRSSGTKSIKISSYFLLISP